MKRHFGTTARLTLSTLVLCLGLSAVVFGQEETAATLNVQVTDSTGAVIPNATVVITNTATDLSRTVETNSEGFYSVTTLVPGNYTVTVEQASFKKHVESGVILNARDRRQLTVVLEAGNVNEVVTVTSEQNVVQDTATGQTLISGTQVLEIPLQNRDFMKLLELAPGISSSLDDETQFGISTRFDVSINGMRRNAVNVFVDGVSNTDVGSNITLLSIPTIDSIAEFKVLTSNYTAEVGRSGGGTVTLVTKGGGNNFHGSLYDFARNDRFNANTFFNNRAGRRADGTLNQRVPRLRYHNFGFTLSGPVWIPLFGEGGESHWNGLDKTFFFFSHEQRRITRGITSIIATVPSLAERNGNFSSSLALPLFLTNAGTGSCTTPGSGTCSTTPIFVTDTNGASLQARAGMVFRLSDNRAYPGNLIPLSDFSPLSAAFLSAYPEPNTGTNQFIFSPINALKTRQETIRIDHNFNSNHRLFGRYTHDLNITQEPGGLFANTNLPNVTTTDTRIPGQTLAISLTSVLSPTFVNEATYNFSSNLIGSHVVGRSFETDFPTLSVIPEVFPENNAGVIPQIGFSSAHANINTLQGFNIVYKNQVVRDVATWNRGNHTFKFGGEISLEKKDENANNITQGLFTFVGTRSRGTSGTISLTQTGLAIADFFLGRADSYSEDQRDVTVNLRFGRREFFAQDTWKLRPNLTLDLGVRYQYFVPVTDENNVLTSFDPALYNRANAPTCTSAACTALVPGTGNEFNGIAIAGVNSRFGDSVYPSDKNNFSPRIGLAWDPFKDGKTIVRFGYGLYYDQPLVGIFEQNSFVNPPFNSRSTFSGPGVTFTTPNGGSLGLPVRDLIASAPDFETPTIQQWSFGVQREIFRNAVVELSYVGTKGDNLIRPLDINQAQPADVLRVGLANINTVRPFLGYRRITWRETSAKSRYHGMLSSFNYRFGSGLTVTASYTFSKTLTDATNDRDAVDFPQNPLDYQAEYAEARTSRPHIFSASYVYEFPFFTKDANPWKRALFGGWQIAGITDITSGQPVARVGVASVQPAAGALTGFYPNAISDPNGGLAGTIDSTGLPFIFDPNALVVPANGTYGNLPRAFARQFGRNQTNLTLTKNIYFNVEKDIRLQLRAESFNVFNHTQFTGVGVNLAAPATLGRPTGARLPREFQFGAKLSF